MSEAKTKKFRFGRKVTIGALGGTVGGMLLFLTFYLFRLAITAFGGPAPVMFEYVGLPLGFGGGALIALEEFGE